MLAIGAFPGDVEVGCSGALLGHAALGHAVTVAVVCGGGEDATRSPGPALSERVAGRIPASFHLMDASGDTFADPDRTDSMQRWLSGLIRDIAPHTVYAPSAHEAQAARLTTHEAAVAATEGAVRSILGYQSPTATVDFRPGLFVNIGATLDKKVDLLALYLASVDRPELSEEFVRAQAQYWGRFARNRVVEPFEVIRRINAKDSASPL